MNTHYVYSMPESFLKDPSVPARWRLLGVLNGFFINTGSFYGSNEWLMEKLGCSQQTVSAAMGELEELGEIRCERTRRSRLVFKAIKEPETQASLGLRHNSTCISDTNQLVPNSESNSEKEIAAKAAFFIEDETPPKPNKENKSRDYQELVEWLRDLTGAPLQDLGKQYKWLKLARDRGFGRERLREHAERLWDSSFYRASGMDWANVVQSLDKTTV